MGNHGGLPPEYNDMEKFICDECPTVFLEKHRLKSHKRHKHSNKPEIVRKEIQCKFCDKKYTGQQNLKEHILRDHEKCTPFQCDQCTRSFGTRIKMKSHKKLV